MSDKTSIRICTCVSKMQDKLYGEGKRLHNYAKNHPDKVHGGWRCTVCGFNKHSAKSA